MTQSEDKIIVYTDGAARGNPGKAGWGVVFLFGNSVTEIGGHSSHATNNQMELTATIEALKYLKNKNMQNFLVEIFCDSKYVILGITEWILNWQRNNWRNAAKKPVMNKELWEELYSLSSKFKIKWMYTPGHNGDKWNDRADEIATNLADGNEIKLINDK